MLQLVNRSPFAATFFLASDPHGIESVYAVVKATFTIGEEVRRAEEQVPIAFKDEFHGEPGRSSLKTASDICLMKPAADVLLAGTAQPVDGRPVTQLDVTLSVGKLSKAVRVFGRRVWRAGVLRDSISPPEPFVTMPLVWERAFGGSHVQPGASPAVLAEPRNPVGIGYHPKPSGKDREGRPLPHLEMPGQLVATVADCPPPAGFGPICPHWEPRRTLAGTYDDAWQQERAPYLPTDFDPRFFQLAPSDQQVRGHLRGHEQVEVVGVSYDGVVRFRLPPVRPTVTFRRDNDTFVSPVNLDTLIIEPDAARFVLVWRTVLPCDKKTLRVREIAIDVEGKA